MEKLANEIARLIELRTGEENWNLTQDIIKLVVDHENNNLNTVDYFNKQVGNKSSVEFLNNIISNVIKENNQYINKIKNNIYEQN